MKPVPEQGVPAAPPVARRVFAERLPLAERYCDWLAGAAILRGLIGPREVPRLWERHLLNCALVSEAIPEGATVADIGSGAGLPGLVLAVRRPDLRVTLIEPLLRRATFLEEVVADLGLDRVEVLRGRAEEFHGLRTFEVVTSRAVAPLDRLARWSLPLTEPGGEFIAMKGSGATTELETAAKVIARLGGRGAVVRALGSELVDPPVTVVRVPRVRG